MWEIPKSRETAGSRTVPGASLPGTLTAFWSVAGEMTKFVSQSTFQRGKKKAFRGKLHLKPSFSHLKALGMLPRNKLWPHQPF